MKKEIFKVQKTLSTNDPQPKALVSNGDRSVEFMTPMVALPHRVSKRLVNRPKAYFYGVATLTGVEFGGDAEPQTW